MKNLWAIIPVKSLHRGKSRLAHVLSVEQREALIRHCFIHVLTILNQVEAIQQTLVISSDELVLTLARSYGALTLLEENRQGLNAAVTYATQTAVAAHAQTVLILPVDLPFLQVDDIIKMIHAPQTNNGTHPHLVICPDDKQDGTNALLLSSPEKFVFQYGIGSFRKHLQEASRLYIPYQIIQTQGLSFDLDTEEDWQIYQQSMTIDNHCYESC